MSKKYSWAMVLGLLSTLLAWIIAGIIFPPPHVPVTSYEKWPAEALAILAENPRGPITQEQWTRIQLINRENNFLNGPISISVKGLIDNWMLVLITPLLLLIATGRFMKLGCVGTGVVFLPSVILLAVSIAIR